MELDPPRTLPRGIGIGRFRVFSSGSVWKSQFTVGSFRVFANPTGMWIHMFLSRPPASRRATRARGSSDRRWASTQPAEPAPTIT